ncbi:MAG: ACP S-malonyltransferase [Candidatus Dormibacteria bacterium]
MSLALIFPGQGAQEPGMGQGLLDRGAPGHELALEAAEITGLDIVGLACHGSADEVRATEVAQPLLLLHSIALLQQLPGAVSDGVVGVAGHSLGEYTALVASGSLDWREALRLVRERGLAMAAASSAEQGMSAVLALSEAQVQAVIDAHPGAGVTVVANLNAPGQVVISGHLERLGALVEPLRAAGARRTLALPVGGAFHSPLMTAAASRLGSAIDRAEFTTGRPQAFNIDGQVRTEPAAVASALKAQLTGAVRWVDCVHTLVELGAERFLELGPGSTLAALGRRIASALEWSSASTPAAVRDAVAG